jgi:cation transport ATPase
MTEKAGIFGVCKTDFVKNFAKRSAREPRYKSIAVILASVAAVVGVIFFVLGYYFAEENAFLSGLVMAIQSVLLCIPASAFVIYALPFYKASQKAYHLDSAIVGEFSLEEYADATVISFDDKEVFPARNVKVHSLKLFGDTRIDHVLFGAASVFHRIGGPLDEVFGVATRESGYSDKVDVLEAAPGGIEAAVDGELVRIGNARYMRAKGLLSAVDPDDTALEMQGEIMVMYLSIGDKLAAKMYITYSADKEIEDIMESLYKAGMCIGIRTLDPNIDDQMIAAHADLANYPVKVLRTDRKTEDFYSEKTESGVVSKKNVRSLLKTLTFCRKVLQVIRTGTVIKVLSMLAGVGVAALILYMSLTGKIGGVYEINSLWIALYQICWLLPAALISLIFV